MFWKPWQCLQGFAIEEPSLLFFVDGSVPALESPFKAMAQSRSTYSFSDSCSPLDTNSTPKSASDYGSCNYSDRGTSLHPFDRRLTTNPDMLQVKGLKRRRLAAELVLSRWCTALELIVRMSANLHRSQSLPVQSLYATNDSQNDNNFSFSTPAFKQLSACCLDSFGMVEWAGNVVLVLRLNKVGKTTNTLL